MLCAIHFLDRNGMTLVEMLCVNLCNCMVVLLSLIDFVFIVLDFLILVNFLYKSLSFLRGIIVTLLEAYLVANMLLITSNGYAFNHNQEAFFRLGASELTTSYLPVLQELCGE